MALSYASAHVIYLDIVIRVIRIIDDVNDAYNWRVAVMGITRDLRKTIVKPLAQR